jgi:ABC-2 type transport system ATP-binding protein
MTVILPKNQFVLDPDRISLPIREVNDTVELKTNDVNACLITLMKHQVDLSDLTIRSPNLETVFLNLTGRQLRD